MNRKHVVSENENKVWKCELCVFYTFFMCLLCIFYTSFTHKINQHIIILEVINNDLLPWIKLQRVSGSCNIRIGNIFSLHCAKYVYFLIIGGVISHSASFNIAIVASFSITMVCLMNYYLKLWFSCLFYVLDRIFNDVDQ